MEVKLEQCFSSLAAHWNRLRIFKSCLGPLPHLGLNRSGLGIKVFKVLLAAKLGKHWRTTELSRTTWEVCCYSTLAGSLISFGIQEKVVKQRKTDRIR
jgi:hypothetical protein